MSFGDGVVTAKGLDKAQLELIDLGQNDYGMALNLKKGSVDIVTLTEAKNVSSGQTVRRTGRILSIGVSDAIFGRIVDPLGQVIDGKPALKPKIHATGVAPESCGDNLWPNRPDRHQGIDAMIPIGRGQRGVDHWWSCNWKTLPLPLVRFWINRSRHDLYLCQYWSKTISIGTNFSDSHWRGPWITLLSSQRPLPEPAAKQFLAPYAGQAIAEYFRASKDVSDRIRRPQQACTSIPRSFIAASSSIRPWSIPWRRLLPSLTLAWARLSNQ